MKRAAVEEKGGMGHGGAMRSGREGRMKGPTQDRAGEVPLGPVSQSSLSDT